MNGIFLKRSIECNGEFRNIKSDGWALCNFNQRIGKSYRGQFTLLCHIERVSVDNIRTAKQWAHHQHLRV